MGLACQFILCSVLWFIMVTIGKTSTPANHWTKKNLACKNTIRVYFTSDAWTTQISGKNFPRYVNQNQFFLAVMGEIVTTADENGVRCTFDKLSYLLSCCDGENLDRLYSVDRKEWTAGSKFWGHDMLRINFVFLFVNVFFFMIILGWGIHILVSYNREHRDNIEMY